jgi:hypothetical protein
VGANIVGANAYAQEARLTQVAPGEYRASIASPTQGSYVVRIGGAQAGRVLIQSAAGMVVAYSAEYRQSQRNPELLAALARDTGGTKLAQPSEAFAHNRAPVYSSREIAVPLLLLALVLLPIDIGVRRLMLRRSDFSAAAMWMRAPRSSATRAAGGQHTSASAQGSGRPTAEEQIERLRAAKVRARRKARGEED